MAIKLRSRPDDAHVVKQITYAASTEVSPYIVTIEHGDGSAAFAARPYPVYVSDRERLRKGLFFKKAKLKGWQYVVFRGKKVLALAGASLSGHPPELAFSSLDGSDVAEKVVAAINRADESSCPRSTTLVTLSRSPAPAARRQRSWPAGPPTS